MRATTGFCSCAVVALAVALLTSGVRRTVGVDTRGEDEATAVGSPHWVTCPRRHRGQSLCFAAELMPITYICGGPPSRVETKASLLALGDRRGAKSWPSPLPLCSGNVYWMRRSLAAAQQRKVAVPRCLACQRLPSRRALRLRERTGVSRRVSPAGRTPCTAATCRRRCIGMWCRLGCRSPTGRRKYKPE
jgi:hypothetical protein